MVKKSKRLVDSLREYFRGILKYSYTTDDYIFYAYSSDNGKKGVNRIWVWDVAYKFSDREFKLLMLICMSTPIGHNPQESGVAWLHEKDYPGFSRQFFSASLKKFVEAKYLRWTEEDRFYIINHKLINSFYKVKRPNNGKRKGGKKSL